MGEERVQKSYIQIEPKIYYHISETDDLDAKAPKAANSK